jgi:hypothetical protein
MEKYSIKNFLESLAEDEIEKEMIRLISKGNRGEILLEKILKFIEETKQ